MPPHQHSPTPGRKTGIHRHTVQFPWIFAVPLWAVTFLLAFLAGNAFFMYVNRDGYRPAVFTIQDAHFTTGAHHRSHYLIGTVGPNKECYEPHDADTLEDRAAVLAHYPIGSQLPVLYNDHITAIIVQDQTYRVIEATYDFQREWYFALGYIALFVVPSVAFMVLLIRRIRAVRATV